MRELPKIFGVDIKNLFGEDPNRPNNIAHHYAMKEEDYDKLVRDFMIDMLKFNRKEELLDKHFPKFSGEQRLKVLAYHTAARRIESIKD